jgi:hypothetical protein
MRQINDHIKDVIGTEPVQKPQQPKPSPNPKKWNWVAIGTWSVIIFFAYKIFKFLISLI